MKSKKVKKISQRVKKRIKKEIEQSGGGPREMNFNSDGNLTPANDLMLHLCKDSQLNPGGHEFRYACNFSVVSNGPRNGGCCGSAIIYNLCITYSNMCLFPSPFAF